MTTPQRIQLRRTKGWRLHDISPNAVVVARPSKWGNPFPVDEYGRELSIQLYTVLTRGGWSPHLLDQLGDQAYQRAYDAAKQWKRRIGGHPTEMARAELRGHDLACWCPLTIGGQGQGSGPNQPCHADVLLAVSNG